MNQLPSAALRAAAEIAREWHLGEWSEQQIVTIIEKHMPPPATSDSAGDAAHEFQSMHGTDSCWHCDKDKSELEQLIETWIEQSAEFSTVSPDDAEDLLLRLIAYESGQRERTPLDELMKGGEP